MLLIFIFICSVAKIIKYIYKRYRLTLSNNLLITIIIYKVANKI